jgi:MFS family permease
VSSTDARPRRRLPGLDDDLPDEVRHQVPVLTLGRLVGNGCFRFAVPFLGVIARSLGVPLTTMGAAVSTGEFTGVLAPFIGHRVDRSRRSRAMAAGMTVMALGALMAAASRGPITIAAAFVCIAIGKLLYDPAMGAWVADRVGYERRARVIGFTELSWAGAMLVVIPLAGLLVAGPGWRWAYVVIAAAALVMSQVVRRRLHDEPRPRRHESGGRLRLDATTVVGLAGFVGSIIED